MICQQVTLSGDAEWPKVADAVIEAALRNHPLSGKYEGFRSIDVTEDWRALYRKEPERIIFVDIGTHTQLYG
jgi:addiction module RelE/StbE family toxin